MTDDEFAAEFEACRIPNELFRHRDHLRLAWIYLHRYGSAEAGARLSVSIRRYASHHGKAHKYHETVTLAWLQLVDHAARCTSQAANLETVLEAFPELLNKSALQKYYSATLLESETARQIFVQPDLEPLPSPHHS
jgi:hypothetical protein